MLMFTHAMKAKTKNHNKANQSRSGRPFHWHLERFFHKSYCILAVAALMGVGMAKSDGKFLGIMRDAYVYSYEMVGSHLKEEPIRAAHGVAYVARITSVTSK